MSRCFGLIEGLDQPCGDTHGAGPIVALELVRNADELARLFGSAGAACADRFAAAQVAALQLDMLAFIPAYGAFLALAGIALRPAEWHTPWVAMAVVAAALLDEVEGLLLMQLVPLWQSPVDVFDALFWAVHLKFALLGLAEAALGVLLLRSGWLARIAGAVMIAGGLVSLWFLLTAPHDPLMMRGHFFAWLALLLLALAAAIRPALAARGGTE